jgi:hypothetical protein
MPTVLLRVRQRLAASPPDDDPAQVVNAVVVEYREELEEHRLAERDERELQERERKRLERVKARKQATSPGPDHSSGPDRNPVGTMGDFMVKLRRTRRGLYDVVEAVSSYADLGIPDAEEVLLSEAARYRSAADVLEAAARGGSLDEAVSRILEEGAED